LLILILQEMDGFSSATTNKEKGIVVIGATNRVSILVRYRKECLILFVSAI